MFTLKASADTCAVTRALTYPLAIHQLPSTTIHEGSHFLVSAAFGNAKKIDLLPSCIMGPNGERMPLPAFGYIEMKKKPSGFETALSAIAPYAVKIFVVDRAVEKMYKNGVIRENSFADKYINTTLALSLDEPLMNSLTKEGDISRFAKATRIPRPIVTGIVWGAYFWSFAKIMKARDGNGTWAFYVHKSF